MEKLLVDTNVFFDYFAARRPWNHEAKLLLFGCAMDDYEIWVSSSQVTDLYFLLTHGDDRIEHEDAVRDLQHLRKCVRVASLSEADVDEALGSGWKDFEDACVYFVAKRIKATCVITRNAKDFRKSKLPVLTPAEFLAKWETEQGITYDEIDL